MKDATRRRLAALGVPRERHHRAGLAELFPPDFRIRQSDLDADALAEVLIHLACGGVIRLPQPSAGHVCRFYHGREELLALLVPFFVSALRQGRGCVWVASGPVGPAEAEAALRRELPDVDARLGSGQLELLREDFYLLPSGRMRPVAELLEAVAGKAAAAERRGFKGFSGAGDGSWAARDAGTLAALLDYERSVDEALSGLDAVALCTYPREAFAGRARELLARHGAAA